MANDKTKKTMEPPKSAGKAADPESRPQKRTAPGQPAARAGSQAKQPGKTGQKPHSTGEKTRPTGEKTRPTGEKIRSTGEKARSTGEKARPTGEKTRSTGEKTRSAGQKPAARTEQTAGKQSAAKQRTTQTARAPRREEGDSGYRPYKAANNRKKQKRTSAVRLFFSAENPIIKGVTGYVDGVRDRNAMRKMTQKYQTKKPGDSPAVIYTQPRAFNRDKLLVQLLTVLAVVLALVLGLSVFFKVKVITVSGAEVYGAWTVREASGISEGDNLLTFGRARAAGKITAKLPYVKSARIGIKLPDTVNIEIEEEDVVYAIKSSDGIWYLMNSEGKVVEQSTSGSAKSYTQVLGVTLSGPVVGEPGIATEEVPTETDEAGEYVPLTVTGAQRLSAALEILQALEENDIVGQAASVDVTRLNDIILWYGTQYQVNLGENTNLSYKIACMNDVILQLSDYQTGILDVSFTTWKEQVGYTPFE